MMTFWQSYRARAKDSAEACGWASFVCAWFITGYHLAGHQVGGLQAFAAGIILTALPMFLALDMIATAWKWRKG